VIVDTSALVALLFREPGFEVINEKLLAAANIGVGAPTLVEAGLVVSARRSGDATHDLARLIRDFAFVTIPFGEEHARVAVEAFARYGKGRHRAALNFGDCMTYAVARLARQPLLCTGDDFARTDLELG